MSSARRSLISVALLAGLLAIVAWVALTSRDAHRGRLAPPAEHRPAGRQPVLTSVTPDHGSVYGGEVVTIRGSGFSGALDRCAGSYDVWFGTDLAEGFAIRPRRFQVISDSEISAVAPANNGGFVNVQVHNRCGTSQIQPGDRFTYAYPPDQCLSGGCSISISSSSIGPLTHTADGLLNGYTSLRVGATPRLRELLDALPLRQWRMGLFDPTQSSDGAFAYCDQCRSRTAISLDLTTDWENWAGVAAPAYRFAPYAALTTYYSFIYNDVRQRLADGQAPRYYDVWNEPATGSIDGWLQVYGTAYRAIKAADPSAQVVGPSLDTFLTTSAGDLTAFGSKLDLTDFLNWEVSSGVRFAALTWHEDGSPVGARPTTELAGTPPQPVAGGRRDDWSPAAIGRHVTEARQLLGRYPALRGTKIFVNEYGPPWGVNMPGWLVGDFAALESARADAGMMTCATVSACTDLMDGLIGYDEQPQMPYWVMRAYADMGGARVAASASGSNLYALATRVDRPRTLEMLIGRADDCWGEVQCPQFQAPAAGPIRLSISAAIPWPAHAVSVSIRRFPNDARKPIGFNDVPLMPQAITSRDRVEHGKVKILIPRVLDGDAFYMTISPAGADAPSNRGRR